MDAKDEIFGVQRVAKQNSSSIANPNYKGDFGYITFFPNPQKGDLQQEVESEKNKLDLSMDQIKLGPKMLNSSYRNSSQMKKSTGAFGFTEENDREDLFDDTFLEGDIETVIKNNQGGKEAKIEIRKPFNEGFDEYTDELLMCRINKGILENNEAASFGEEVHPQENSRH